MELNLDDFVALTRTEIEAFYRWWTAQNKENPEAFPMKLPIGHWDEQFRVYVQLKEDI